MKIAVLGTGMVGQAHAGKLAQLGHDVVMGTKDPDKKRNDAQPGRANQPSFAEWLKSNPKVKLDTFDNAANHGEVILEAINGLVVVETLAVLKDKLAGKLLVDISNALDFSGGELKITTANGPSLGEQIQKVLPDTKVVKAFNTMNASVQIDPKALAGGDHHLFIAGDDIQAKQQFSRFAKDWYGWQNILDLGDIKAARGMEMLMPFWLSLLRQAGHSNFNYKITGL